MYKSVFSTLGVCDKIVAVVLGGVVVTILAASAIDAYKEWRMTPEEKAERDMKRKKKLRKLQESIESGSNL